MDLVYILGTGSKWQNNEIRYSLRSVERNVPHRGIFVIGERPEWLSGITHIPAPDAFDHKLKNATEKLRVACRDERISERFVLMNDDFFFLQPLICTPAFQYGSLKEMIKKYEPHKHGYYYKAIVETYKLLKGIGHENPISYEVHCPMVIEKKNFLEITDLVDWKTTGYLFRSVYGNVYGIGGSPRKDVKAFSTVDLSRFKKGDILSISDKVALSPKFQEWISQEFPKPSKFESISAL